jgi:DNA polymerase III subunit gamma/tau
MQRPQRPAVPVADDVPPWDDIPPADLDAPPAPPMGTIDVGGAEPRRTDDVALVAPPADAPALPTYEPDPGNDAWVALARRLIAANAVQALTRELAVQAQCIGSRIDPEHAGRTRWTLRVERESLRQPGHVDKLVKAVREVTGDEVLIDLEAGAVIDNLARRDAHHKALVQAQAEESFRTDPRVVQLLGRFATARIVPGSIRPV